MIFKICGIVMICLAASMLLKCTGNNMHTLVVAAGFLCSIVIIISGIVDTFEPLENSIKASTFSAYALILIKALGISYITMIISEICRSAGEELLSNITSGAGKIEILLLCAPMIIELLEITGKLL